MLRDVLARSNFAETQLKPHISGAISQSEVDPMRE